MHELIVHELVSGESSRRDYGQQGTPRARNRSVTRSARRSWEPDSSPTRPSAAVWPPQLVSTLRERLSRHVALAGVPDLVLDALLTTVFFASLQTEELEHHAIRVAFVGRRSLAAIPVVSDPIAAAHYRWRALPFRAPTTFNARDLVRLARASSERLFAMVALTRVAAHDLEIVGIAREGFRHDEHAVLKIIASSPGTLEVWSGGERALEYRRGLVRTPPENVLLATGPVRRALESFAREECAPRSYLSSVSELVRAMAAHGYGGILIVSCEASPTFSGEVGYLTESDVPMCALLDQLEREDVIGAERHSWIGGAPANDAAQVVRDAVEAEIERTIEEIGRLTALDGATILDRGLGVRGFGVVLPVAPTVPILEALDAEAARRVDFPLERFGARHRAAASYASTHPGSVLFVASVDGGLACMLRESPGSPVLVWRFAAQTAGAR